MKNGDFFNKIKRLRLNVTKFHRHVFENLGCKAERDETVIVETILPDKIGNDCYLCFRSAKQDMRFYDVRIEFWQARE